MRKIVGLIAILAIGVVAAAAYAAQSNVYTVQGSVRPNKGGSKAKPSPLRLNFDFQVKEAAGDRPAVVKSYKIGFFGGSDHGELFPKCTAQQINAAQSDKGCPKGSLVGKATIGNHAGTTSDPTDTSIPCDLDMLIYNAGKHRAALYLHGTPPTCVISISQAIDAKYVSAFGGKGTALQFEVPENLRHPLSGLDVAQVDVKSTINRLTKKVGGKTRGYLEADQKCPKNRKVPIQVTFTTEDGRSATAKATTSCR